MLRVCFVRRSSTWCGSSALFCTYWYWGDNDHLETQSPTIKYSEPKLFNIDQWTQEWRSDDIFISPAAATVVTSLPHKYYMLELIVSKQWNLTLVLFYIFVSSSLQMMLITRNILHLIKKVVVAICQFTFLKNVNRNEICAPSKSLLF